MRLALFAALAVGAAVVAVGSSKAQAEPPKLAFPLACEIGRSCEIQHYVDRDPGPGMLDYRCGHRVEDKHDGIDFRLTDMAAQRAGVDVLAAAAGRVIAVRDGVPDISIRAPGAPSTAGHQCGNRVAIGLGDGWILDYCHLARGSLKVKVGDAVAAGQPLAHVGLSGDTEFPHLHFSVRHANQVVDPFAPATTTGCEAQAESLWIPAVVGRMPYRRGVALNTGFASAQTSGPAIEERAAPAASADGPALVAYARLIGVELGDVIAITVLGPDGKALVAGTLPPLDHDKDEFLAQVGRKRPPQGWARGVYTAVLEVRRAGAVAIRQRWQTTL
jgi:hypothetical protein